MTISSTTRPWWQRLRRSVAFRNALLTMAVAMVTTAIALTVQYRQTASSIENELRESIESDMSVFIGEYGLTGRQGLIKLFNRMTSSVDFDDNVYSLAGKDGAILAGNLKAWPTGVTPGRWFHLQFLAQEIGGKRSRWIEVSTIRLGGGHVLLVGRPADSLATLRQRYLSDMGWALLVTACTGLALGWLTSRSIFSFMDRYADAMRRFHAGDLSARVPVSDRGNEFDQLGVLINTATDMSERSNATLRAASDSLAHDLKTPITAMRGRLELALRRSDINNIHNETLQKCIEDVDRQLGQINAMLQLVRAESATDAQFQCVDLADIVTDICETFEPIADDRNIDLAFQILPLKSFGMKPLIAQAIANLIDNAIKYTPDGGSIDVFMRQNVQTVSIIVADTGPGIADENKARAIDRFVRLDSSRTTTGAGLGLHYVNTVARVHHGSLALENEAPGLRVVFTLPLHE